MVDKYGRLADCARSADGPRDDAFKRALSELSSRWPGALREGELIGPARVAARRRAAELGEREPARTRTSWIETPARAALCWAELHVLIRDQLAYRRASAADTPKPPFSWAAFARWVASEDERAARWPEALLDDAGLGAKLGVRSAYLCLAARAGLELPALNELLFARTGHWDRRAEDPPWAHA